MVFDLPLCTLTDTEGKPRERPESGIYLKIFEKKTIFNEHPVAGFWDCCRGRFALNLIFCQPYYGDIQTYFLINSSPCKNVFMTHRCSSNHFEGHCININLGDWHTAQPLPLHPLDRLPQLWDQPDHLWTSSSGQAYSQTIILEVNLPYEPVCRSVFWSVGLSVVFLHMLLSEHLFVFHILWYLIIYKMDIHKFSFA